LNDKITLRQTFITTMQLFLKKKIKNRRELIKIDPIAFMKKITKSLKLIILSLLFFCFNKKIRPFILL